MLYLHLSYVVPCDAYVPSMFEQKTTPLKSTYGIDRYVLMYLAKSLLGGQIYNDFANNQESRLGKKMRFVVFWYTYPTNPKLCRPCSPCVLLGGPRGNQ